MANEMVDYSLETLLSNLIVMKSPTRGLHGPVLDGPARPGPRAARPVAYVVFPSPARPVGGPARPVAYVVFPGPARPVTLIMFPLSMLCPARATSATSARAMSSRVLV